MKGVERTKWYLWHGNVFHVLQEIESITMDLDAAGAETTDATVRKLLKSVRRVPDLHREECGLHPQLWRAVALWRAD